MHQPWKSHPTGKIISEAELIHAEVSGGFPLFLRLHLQQTPSEQQRKSISLKTWNGNMEMQFLLGMCIQIRPPSPY